MFLSFEQLKVGGTFSRLLGKEEEWQFLDLPAVCFAGALEFGRGLSGNEDILTVLKPFHPTLFCTLSSQDMHTVFQLGQWAGNVRPARVSEAACDVFYEEVFIAQ